MNPLEFRLDLVDDALDVGRIGDVGGVPLGGPAGLADRLEGRFQALQGPRHARDRRPAGRQPDRDRPADAARGARDQRHLTRQIDATARRNSRSLPRP